MNRRSIFIHIWQNWQCSLCWRFTRLQCRGHKSWTCLVRLSNPGFGALGGKKSKIHLAASLFPCYSIYLRLTPVFSLSNYSLYLVEKLRFFSSILHFCLRPVRRSHYSQCHYDSLSFFSFLLHTVSPAFMSLYWYVYSFELLLVFTLLCKHAERINIHFQRLYPSDLLTTYSH